MAAKPYDVAQQGGKSVVFAGNYYSLSLVLFPDSDNSVCNPDYACCSNTETTVNKMSDFVVTNLMIKIAGYQVFTLNSLVCCCLSLCIVLV